MAPPQIDTDVLVVGSGPAGASMALALATLGVDHVLVTRYASFAGEPRAHITNQRTMEVLRDLGVEDRVRARATPQELIGTTTFCTSLTGEELGRVRSWGTDPLVRAAHELASPSRICDMPQNLMEPVLVDAAVARGTRLRHETEYVSHVQDADGVTVTVRDRLRDDTYEIRCRYLYGADGGRSRVAEDAGLPMRGEMGVAGSLNILFRADLSHLVAHRPSVLYWILQPGSDIGGIGMGVVRMVRPWDEWLTIWGYDVADGPPDLSDEFTRGLVRQLVGDPDLDVEITGSSAWTVNHMAADVYSAGRVLCGGDAVHRHPPSNGLGSNTSIQDSFNLAWKLAYVLDGRAGAALLDTYTVERAPIGRQVVDRANRSIGETGKIFDALGLGDGTDDPATMRASMDARKEPGAVEQRRALRDAIAFKVYEFDAHGVELNQRYDSAAVVADAPGSTLRPDPLTEAADPELHHVPATVPGARLPHVWLTDRGRDVSTLDLTGHGRFTLVTAPGGEAWEGAAEGTGVDVVVVGPGRRVEDPYGDWSRLREADGVGDDGAILVRPDHHVCWRSAGLPSDPRAALTEVLDTVLAR